MSNPYAGADTFPATIPVLDDGDPPVAATWAPALEGLADRTVFLYEALSGSDLHQVEVEDTVPGTHVVVDSFTLLTFEEGTVFLDVSDCEVGDVFVVDAHFMAEASASVGLVRLYRREDQTSADVKTSMNETHKRVFSAHAAATDYSMHTSFTIANAGTCRVGIEGSLNAGGQLDILAGYVIRARRIKPVT